MVFCFYNLIQLSALAQFKAWQLWKLGLFTLREKDKLALCLPVWWVHTVDDEYGWYSGPHIKFRLKPLEAKLCGNWLVTHTFSRKMQVVVSKGMPIHSFPQDLPVFNSDLLAYPPLAVLLASLTASRRWEEILHLLHLKCFFFFFLIFLKLWETSSRL